MISSSRDFITKFKNLVESIVLFSSPIFTLLRLPFPAHPAVFFSNIAHLFGFWPFLEGRERV